MRLWSLHPKYLDSKGLVALWREGLLAQAVLAGKTKGYKNHPQLIRFKTNQNPLQAMSQYLQHVHTESGLRGYHFNHSKIIQTSKIMTTKNMIVTRGQLLFEWNHLSQKLQKRDPEHWKKFAEIQMIRPHPSFKVMNGPIAEWERGV